MQAYLPGKNGNTSPSAVQEGNTAAAYATNRQKLSTVQREQLAHAAEAFLQSGVSLIPVGYNKRPLSWLLPVKKDADGKVIFKRDGDGNLLRDPRGNPKREHTWEPYQEHPPTAAEVKRWLQDDHLLGLGCIGGKVSGGLLILDFDSARFYEAWRERVSSLIEGLPLQRTGGGGYQLWLRCQHPGENQKLAWMPDETQESGRSVAIETRGEGGYGLAPCSLHPSGNLYQALAGDFYQIPFLDDATVNTLLAAARDLDEAPFSTQEIRRYQTAPEWKPRQDGSLSVIDAYNAAVSIRQVLEAHGYVRVGSRYARPNGESGSVILLADETGKERWSYHFSSNDALDDRHRHSAFSVFCELDHNGDVRAAVRAAARQLGLNLRAEGVPDASQANQGALPHFACTDVGNAERLVYWHGTSIRYCHPWKTWLLWDGRRWVRDEHNQIEHLAIKAVRAIYREAEQAEDEHQQKALAQHALRSQHDQRIKAMIRLAQAMRPIAPSELDRHPWLLNVQNGTIDLQTGHLRPHNPEDFLTRLCPIEYNPAAACPTWQRFLEQVLPDPELRCFMQRAFGYSLSGSTREQCIFFLYGEGSNGKSTLAYILWALLSNYGEKVRAEAFMVQSRTQASAASPEIAKLAGARLVEVSEIQDGHRLNEALIKDATGGDAITARFLHCNEFTFQPAFKVWMYGNHKPTIRGQDTGIWRRVRIIPFLQQFKGTPAAPVPGYLPKDDEIRDKLLAELPGILAWAVQGCLAWQQDGLPLPEAVAEATEAYRAEMDVLKPFLDDRCMQAPRCQVTKAALWQAYEQWARLAGEQVYETMKHFNRAIAKRPGITEGKGTAGVRIWRGIGLLTGPDTPQDERARRDSGASGASGATLPKFSINTRVIEKERVNSATSATSATSTPGRDLLNLASATAGATALRAALTPIQAQEACAAAVGLINLEDARQQRAGTPASAQCEACGAEATFYAPHGTLCCEAHLPKKLYAGCIWFDPAAEDVPALQALRWACGEKPERISAWSVPSVLQAFQGNSQVGTLEWGDAHGTCWPLTAKGFVKELRAAYHAQNQPALLKFAQMLGVNPKQVL